MNKNEKGASDSGKQDLGFWTRDFVLIALLNFMMVIGFNLTTIGMPVYVASLGASDALVGLVTTLATGAALLIRPLTGFMLDYFGRKGILIVGTTMMTLVIAAYAVFPIVGFILALRVIQGLGWGLASTATSTIAADIIPKKRFAEGMGYFALTSSVAIAFSPALSIALVQHFGPLPMLAIAGACSAMSLIFAFLQHPKKPRQSKKTSFSFKNLFDKRALLPACIMFLMTTSLASISTFIALHGQAQGVENVFLYFVVYAFVTILTRPFIVRVIDRRGFFYPGIMSTIGMVITLLLISFAHTTLMFCIAGIFAGLGLGAGMGTLQAMAVAAVPPERKGLATATFMLGFDAGITLGASIAGQFAMHFGYSLMYLIMSIFPLAACIVFLCVGKKRVADYSS